MNHIERRIVRHVRNKAAAGNVATVGTIRSSVNFKYDKLLDVIDRSERLDIESPPEPSSPHVAPAHGGRRVWLVEAS